MDIWKGAILGNLHKHRDYAHADFYEHMLAGGAIAGFKTREEEEYVDIIDYIEEELDEEELEAICAETKRLLEYWFSNNPITGLKFKNPKLYYALVLTLSETQYDYFIPAPSGCLMPHPELIRETLEEYTHNYDAERQEHIEEYLVEQR